MEKKFKDAPAKKVLFAPIIDLEELHDSGEMEKLYEALVNTGFMYISNHGIEGRKIRFNRGPNFQGIFWHERF